MTGRAVIVVAIVALAAPAAASAQRQTFEARFTTDRPGAATGYTVAIDYLGPGDPSAKPHAVQRIVLEPPVGSRIDTAAPARCEASEPELMLLGAEACPAESRVGAGELDLHTGAIVSSDRVTLLNAADQLIFLTQPKDAPFVNVVTRAQIREDGAIVTTVPPLPGLPPPDPFVALDRAQLAVDAVVDAAGRAYVTTPPECPLIGIWTWRATFEYRDGVTETVESPTPCAAPPVPEPAAVPERCLPRRLRVSRAGVGVLEVGRAGAAGPRCVDGGGRVVATTRAGRVRLVATTAPGHAIGGVHPGSSTRRLERAFPAARRVRRGLRRHGTILFGTRGDKVRFIAVTGRREVNTPALLRRELRRAGLAKP